MPQEHANINITDAVPWGGGGLNPTENFAPGTQNCLGGPE